MGRVSTCQKNCNTIDLRRAQVNKASSVLVPGLWIGGASVLIALVIQSNIVLKYLYFVEQSCHAIVFKMSICLKKLQIFCTL